MLIIYWIAWMNCVAYALHCPNKRKYGLFYLIDLHAGMVINCVDLNDLILELKSPCFTSPSVGEYCGHPPWWHYPGGKSDLSKSSAGTFDAQCSKALDRLALRLYQYRLVRGVIDFVLWLWIYVACVSEALPRGYCIWMVGWFYIDFWIWIVTRLLIKRLGL